MRENPRARVLHLKEDLNTYLWYKFKRSVKLKNHGGSFILTDQGAQNWLCELTVCVYPDSREDGGY